MKKIIFGISVFLCACSESKQVTSVPAQVTAENIAIKGKIFTSLFQQKAAEYRALCLQGYNIARLRIDGYVATGNKPKAIITDIDETIFDNSAYELHQTLQGKDYDGDSWHKWTAMGTADTMPGAAAFLKYVASKNVEIFYITNRDSTDKAGTLKNMQHFNLPNADDKHVIVRQTGSSKETRRQNVMATHEVILLMGDNLADFSSLFDKKTLEERQHNTDLSAAEFGKRFIFFPNPVYGDWESSLFKYNYKLTQAQKDSVMRSVLKSY